MLTTKHGVSFQLQCILNGLWLTPALCKYIHIYRGYFGQHAAALNTTNASHRISICCSGKLLLPEVYKKPNCHSTSPSNQAYKQPYDVANNPLRAREKAPLHLRKAGWYCPVTFQPNQNKQRTRSEENLKQTFGSHLSMGSYEGNSALKFRTWIAYGKNMLVSKT